LCGDRRHGCMGTGSMVVWGQKAWLYGDQQNGSVGTESLDIMGDKAELCVGT